ncbi:MAG TPA: hypothetical protein VLW65_00605 [Bryobacteraceae bacterium]|nr:hypothetical protein [Bryobacteraceae bacterium]
MKDTLLKLYAKMQIFKQDHGQDLIEYLLVAALVALAATAGMTSLATSLNKAFSAIASTLTAYAT